jgi:hypothetical protein
VSHIAVPPLLAFDVILNGSKGGRLCTFISSGKIFDVMCRADLNVSVYMEEVDKVSNN